MPSSPPIGRLVLLLIVLYRWSNPSTHLGSFFGNAIADWTGVFVTVVMTKFLYEKGSAESKQPKGNLAFKRLEFLREHSLTMILLVSPAVGWVVAFRAMDSEQQVGTSRRQHRVGVDADFRPRPDDQASDGGRLERAMNSKGIRSRRQRFTTDGNARRAAPSPR